MVIELGRIHLQSYNFKNGSTRLVLGPTATGHPAQ